MESGFLSTEDTPAKPRRLLRAPWVLAAAVLAAAAGWYVWPFLVPDNANAGSFRDQDWCKAHESRPIRLTGTTFATLDDSGPVYSDTRVEGRHYAVWLRDPSSVVSGSRLGKVSCSVQLQSSRPYKPDSPVDMVGNVCGYLSVGGSPYVRPDGKIDFAGGKSLPVFCEKGVAPDTQRSMIIPNSETLQQIAGCMR